MSELTHGQREAIAFIKTLAGAEEASVTAEKISEAYDDLGYMTPDAYREYIAVCLFGAGGIGKFAVAAARDRERAAAIRLQRETAGISRLEGESPCVVVVDELHYVPSYELDWVEPLKVTDCEPCREAAPRKGWQSTHGPATRWQRTRGRRK